MEVTLLGSGKVNILYSTSKFKCSFRLNIISVPLFVNSFFLFEQIPHTIQVFALDISVKMGRTKVREEFLKNAHVKDLRVIDMLVIKVWLKKFCCYNILYQFFSLFRLCGPQHFLPNSHTKS